MFCDPPLRILNLSCADLVVRLLLRSSHRGWSPGQTRRANSRLTHRSSKAELVDHFVGECENLGRNFQSERVRGLAIDD
jgi:hypothetical protein